jgi:uncharacterized membrane protein
MKTKILWNKWHAIVIILYIILLLFSVTKICSNIESPPESLIEGTSFNIPTFSECISQGIFNITPLLILIIIYLIITFLSWLYYNKYIKRRK